MLSQMMSEIVAMERVKNLPPEQALEVTCNIMDILVELITWWDLVEADGGSMVALTHERLERLGLRVLWDILMAMMRETSLGEQSAVARSPESSTATWSPAPARRPTRAR